MAELKNRFLYVNQSVWDKIGDKSIYNNSIVFVKNDNGDGVAIYTQGATFGTLDEVEVKAIIESYGYLTESNFNTAKDELIQAIADAKSGAISDANAYTDAEIKKVSDAIAGKNVSAEGDDYVNATAVDNKVTVSATEKTIASLALADSAVQSVVTGETNGTIKVDGEEVAVAGLGSAAYETKEYFEGYADDAAGAVKTELLGGAAEGTTLKSLSDAIANVSAEAKSYSIAKVEGDLDANVKEAFKLVDEDGAQVGETINIYKDSSLVSIELVDADKDGNAGQFLKYVYVLANGNQETVYVDANKFLVQSEFKNGLQVNTAGEVSVKVKEGETYLKVGADGVYTEGIDTAISTAVTTAVEALDANFENVDATGAGEGEVSVVSGVNLTQVDGVITALTVNSAAAATKAYVDSKAAAATTTLKLGEGNESFLTLTEETVDTATQYTITINGVQTAIDTAVTNLGSTEAEADKYITKIAVVDGKLTNEAAYISSAKLAEFATTSTDKYVGIEATDTINGAFDKVERAWDWAEITE